MTCLHTEHSMKYMISLLIVIMLTVLGCKKTEIGIIEPERIPEGFTPIRVEGDFQMMRDAPTENYILMNDITITTNPTEFEPIGNSITPFRGIFDGNGRTISNLKITRSDQDEVGFFGRLGDGNNSTAEIRNLILELASGHENNPSILGYNAVGGLVGYNYGIIQNVLVRGGYVRGNFRVGGITGENAGTITFVAVTEGKITGSNHIGGVVGWADRRIENSYATAETLGVTCVGGLIGYTAVFTTVENSYAIGRVHGNTEIGGLIGCNNGATTIASYFDVILTEQGQGIGDNQGSANVIPYYTNTAANPALAYKEATYATAIKQDDFSNWDFIGSITDGSDDIWRWRGDGYWPVLSWQ